MLENNILPAGPVRHLARDKVYWSETLHNSTSWYFFATEKQDQICPGKEIYFYYHLDF